MIHYIDGVPKRNIRMAKAKKRAVEQYRHNQAVAAITDVLVRVVIVFVVFGLLAGIFLYKTA